MKIKLKFKVATCPFCGREWVLHRKLKIVKLCKHVCGFAPNPGWVRFFKKGEKKVTSVRCRVITREVDTNG